jgi:flagellar protein FliO/FliZ
MTTRTRLLAILAVSLPLAACAAPQPPAQAPAAQAPAVVAPAVPAAKPGQDVQAGSAAVAPAPAAAAAQPAAGNHQPRRPIGASAAAAASAPATEPASVPAPAANAPAIDSASPAAPETTVGGGAANRTAPVTPPVKMPAGSATGSLLQTLFALIVVLAVLGALAWFLKRYGPKGMGGSANLRVVGSLNLGGRERLLVVEIGNQWIVVGASPGRVNALATMPRQESADMSGTGATLAQGAATASPPANSFADWLKQTIDKRK